MRIQAGQATKYIYFVAVDPTDLKTRETGLSSFTVYYSINGGAATAMTTPTVNETDSTNMPGVYELLIDEAGMATLTAGEDTHELCLHITHGSMAPVTRTIEIYRTKITSGLALTVSATGAAKINWSGIENTATTVDLSNTSINLVDTASVATSVTNPVILTDESLTANKFDQSTAFPLTSADTGATRVARVGADSDTLETLSDQLDTITTNTGNIETDTQDIQARLPAALVGGRMDSDAVAISGSTTAADNVEANIGNLDASIAGLNDISSGDVETACGTALGTYDGPTKTEMDAAFTEIKGATWSSATDTLEHIRDKETDIETDTQDLQTQVGTAGAGLTAVPWNTAWDAEVESECTDALNTYDPPTNAEMEARTLAAASYATAANQTNIEADTQDIQTQIGTAGAGLTDLGGMSTGMKAEVNAEVADVLTTDTLSELSQGAPSATPTFETAVMMLYMALRNRVDVDTTGGTDYKEFYNDSGTVVYKKAVSDDGSTYTEAEMETGP